MEIITYKERSVGCFQPIMDTDGISYRRFVRIKLSLSKA